MTYYIGVDVGTSSVRVALVDNTGTICKISEEAVIIKEPHAGHYEQSSEEIWTKCCKLVKAISGNIDKSLIHGIGFDATCSLVVLDESFNPVQVNNSYKDVENQEFNIIMWCDHRAEKQAETINDTNHEILKFVGSKMSLEMEPPKVLWLKQENPQAWSKAAHFFELPDFMTFKATGSLSRSLCPLVCKWAYHPEQGWVKTFWVEIGLEDITQNDFGKLGRDVLYPGVAVGSGLSSQSAQAMGLLPGTPVGASLIDGHCGGIGTVGADVPGQTCLTAEDMSHRIAMICGTSSCHMAVSKNPTFVPGVWGPYKSAMLPDMWLNEGGQSATGKLIDYIIDSHPACKELESISKKSNSHRQICLNQFLDSMSGPHQRVDHLTRHLHVWPDYHGNRSPVADPTLTGAVCGLTLDSSLRSLALLYLAVVQSLANGSKHIVGEMEKAGHNITTVFMCGGLSKNDLFVQVHANVLGRPIVLGKESETVLLGAAVLGASASGDFNTLQAAMQAMSKCGKVVLPCQETAEFYAKKYKVFLSMLKHQLEYREIMSTP